VHAKYLKPEALADPQVGPLFAVVDDLVVKLAPSRWIISWDMGALNQQAFDNRFAAHHGAQHRSAA
jgi:hypothetical protein